MPKSLNKPNLSKIKIRNCRPSKVRWLRKILEFAILLRNSERQSNHCRILGIMRLVLRANWKILRRKLRSKR